jgi:hypothetical protein
MSNNPFTGKFRDLAQQWKELRQTLMYDTGMGSPEEEQALLDLIRFAKDHRDFARIPECATIIAGDLDMVFRDAAVRSAGQRDSTGWRVIRAISDYLPARHKIDIFGWSRTGRAWVHFYDDRRHSPAAVALLGMLTRLNQVQSSSQDAEAALAEAIAGAQPPDIDHEVRAMFKRMMVVRFAQSLKAYQDDPAGNPRCLAMAQAVVAALPADIRIELGGEDLSLRDHVWLARGLASLGMCLKADLESDQQRAAVRELLAVLDSGIDCQLEDGSSFTDLARTALLRIAFGAESGSDTAALIIDRLHITIDEE